MGRWTQRDPSGMDANPYAYVGGDPVNLVDPDGLFPIKTASEALKRAVQAVSGADSVSDLIGDLKNGISRVELMDVIDDISGFIAGGIAGTGCGLVVAATIVPTGGASAAGSAACVLFGAGAGEAVQNYTNDRTGR